MASTLVITFVLCASGSLMKQPGRLVIKRPTCILSVNTGAIIRYASGFTIVFKLVQLRKCPMMWSPWLQHHSSWILQVPAFIYCCWADVFNFGGIGQRRNAVKCFILMPLPPPPPPPLSPSYFYYVPLMVVVVVSLLPMPREHKSTHGVSEREG